MGDKSAIQWTDASWNCIRGCSRVSDGCTRCYAESIAHRFSGPGKPYEGLTRIVNGRPTWNGKITLLPDLLTLPLRWKRPRRIFVNSMSDLFHEGVPDAYIDKVFAVMALAPRHTFQILTKRAERMRGYMRSRAKTIDYWEYAARELGYTFKCDGIAGGLCQFPLPNVQLGVSVEDQARANERVPILLRTPSAVWFVSYEPALGEVNWRRLELGGGLELDAISGCHKGPAASAPLPERLPGLSWIIVGGESGRGARPFDMAWARSTIEQCGGPLKVPVFVKQLGREPQINGASYALDLDANHGGDPNEWPLDLRVREFPRAIT